MNLTSLYTREHVPFQITSKAWLVTNGWLKQSEVDNKAIYVKRLELFLPTVSEDSVTYISKVRAVGEYCLLYFQVSAKSLLFTFTTSLNLRHPIIEMVQDKLARIVFQF